MGFVTPWCLQVYISFVFDGQDARYCSINESQKAATIHKKLSFHQSFEEETQTHWPETIIKYISAQTESLLKNLHKQT